jgi:class 3 adenylate cyclase
MRAEVLRIGINVGDIIIENDDIYGDGVNVAARLEALAFEPFVDGLRKAGLVD